MEAAALMTALIAPGRGQNPGNRNSGELTIPFDYAADRGSLLVRARVNSRAVVLILDTGSTHTILRPSVAGLSAFELQAPHVGGGVIGDAVAREVTLEIGRRVWTRRPVSVMDLSAALALYRERIDGLLGIDVLFEFSQAVINFKTRSLTLVP